MIKDTFSTDIKFQKHCRCVSHRFWQRTRHKEQDINRLLNMVERWKKFWWSFEQLCKLCKKIKSLAASCLQEWLVIENVMGSEAATPPFTFSEGYHSRQEEDRDIHFLHDLDDCLNDHQKFFQRSTIFRNRFMDYFRRTCTIFL